MTKPLMRYASTVGAVALTVHLVPGIAVSGGWQTILLVALVWSVIVSVIRPVLKILTFPITLLTFGLFSVVLNALLFWTMERIVPGFSIEGFVSALFGALVLSVLTWLIQKVF
jgi:putative membrane protein